MSEIKCEDDEVFSGQMNNIIISHFIRFTDCMHVALADWLSKIIMVRDRFLSLPTWFSHDVIDDVISSVYVFRPSALFYCFLCSYCISVCHVLRVRFYN